ncbi:protein PAXX isoform X2 [Podarcis raffonei]|uniref:protein PAXX isoform X2 n=1 Tax=Podarcis raffonei TaxID=65483 RepID=UPI00232944D4|nr:protein PAXX isoform X2 [Podarcis raffonei]
MGGTGIVQLVQSEGQDYLCFCSSKSDGSLSFHVTNACDSWSGDITSSEENQPVSSDDRISQIKDAFESQTPKLSVRETEATLTFQDGRETLTFDLHRDPASRARERVRELLFGLAGRVRELERRLGDPNPAKIRTGSSKRKLPGESLINPGFVRKKTPTGVDFEDA